MHDANVMIGANVITDQRATEEEPIYKRALAQNLDVQASNTTIGPKLGSDFLSEWDELK